MVNSPSDSRKNNSLGLGSGVVVEPVAITQATGYVTQRVIRSIEAIGGSIFYEILLSHIRNGLDDSLDIWGIHEMATLTTDIFAGATVIYARIVTCALTEILDKTIGLCVTKGE